MPNILRPIYNIIPNLVTFHFRFLQYFMDNEENRPLSLADSSSPLAGDGNVYNLTEINAKIQPITKTIEDDFEEAPENAENPPQEQEFHEEEQNTQENVENNEQTEEHQDNVDNTENPEPTEPIKEDEETNPPPEENEGSLMVSAGLVPANAFVEAVQKIINPTEEEEAPHNEEEEHHNEEEEQQNQEEQQNHEEEENNVEQKDENVFTTDHEIKSPNVEQEDLTPRSNQESETNEIEENNDDEQNNEDEDENMDDIHTDINSGRDTVKIYSGDEPPKTAPLTQVPSLTKLPPLATTPEIDEENALMLKKYLATGRFPPHNQREQLIQYVQREKINALVQNDYVKAQKMHDTVTTLLKELTISDSKARTRSAFQSLEEKLEVVKDEITKTNKDLKKALKAEENKQKNRRKTLIAQQNLELDEFEEHWNDETFLRMNFAKPSSQLLMLKQLERQMILAKMFDRADEIKKKSIELEKKESAEAQETAYQERDKAQKKIEERHKLALDVFEQHSKKIINQIQRNHDIKMQALEARKTKLESEIEEMKRTQTSAPLKLSPIPENVETVMTARTAQRYSSYKTTKKSPMITIKPLGKIKRRKIGSAV